LFTKVLVVTKKVVTQIILGPKRLSARISLSVQ